MNKKQLLILGLFMVGLLSLLVLKRAEPRNELYVQDSESLAFDIDTNQIDYIEVSKGDDQSISAKKLGNVWRIPDLWNAAADPAKLNSLLSEVKAMRGDLRGNSEELYSDFGISDDESVQIALGSGDEIQLNLLIGTKKPSYKQLFVRKAETPAVFLIESEVLNYLRIYGDIAGASLDLQNWLNLKFFDIDIEEIERIETKLAEGEWQVWDPAAEETSGEDTKKEYLQGLASLRAKTVVDPEGEYGLSNPEFSVKYVLKGGEAIVVSFNADGEISDEYHMQITDRPEVFVITQDTYSKLDPNNE